MAAMAEDGLDAAGAVIRFGVFFSDEQTLMKNIFLFTQSLLIATGLLVLLYTSAAIAGEPLEVDVALKIDQITSIDQKSENFGVVATLTMKWITPELAAKPGEHVPPQRIYKGDDFLKIVTERHLLWPAHSFHNLQGRIDYQNRIVAIDPKGNISYLARFTATFQAPDFDFEHFPFDVQNFFIKLDSFIPEHLIRFKPVIKDSGLGDALGEEEWILENAKAEVIKHEILDITAPRLVLSFQGKRHLVYYVVRILIPVLIIILVSWFTFFLKDYGKRIDLASGNLLLFIAFNFTIANDLPRLGYITLMDTFMMATFGITGLVVFLNVWMKRLQRHGREKYLDVLDGVCVWIYPLLYLGGGGLMFMLFYN